MAMMSVKIQPTKGVSFELMAAPSDTVRDLKKKIMEAQPELTEQMKLVHVGRILCDATELKDASIKPSCPFVVVASRKRLKAELDQADEQHTQTAPTDPHEVVQPDPQAAVPTTEASLGTAQEVAEPDQLEAPPSEDLQVAPQELVSTLQAGDRVASLQTAPVSITPAPQEQEVLPPVPNPDEQEVRAPVPNQESFGEARAVAVQNLCDLGFDLGEVERCLDLAFGNPDRAAEYLMTGIPVESNPPNPPTRTRRLAEAFEELPDLSSTTQRNQILRDTMENVSSGMDLVGFPLGNTRVAATSAPHAETDWEVQADSGWAPFRPGVPFQGQSGEQMYFYLNGYAYTASFQNESSGMQTNVGTGRQRQLRRRQAPEPLRQPEPGLCGREDLPSLQAHELEFLVPPCPDFANGQAIRSEISKSVGDFQFRLLVFPRGTQSTNGSKVSVFVEAVPPAGIPDNRWVFEGVKYQITLVNWIDYRVSVTKSDTWSFNKDGTDRGWHDLLSLTELTSEKGWTGPNGEMLLRACCFCPYAGSHRVGDDYCPQSELGLLKWTSHEPLPAALLQSLSHISAFKHILNSCTFASPVAANMQKLLQDLLISPEKAAEVKTSCNPGQVLQALGWHELHSWGGKAAGELLADLCTGLGNDRIKQLFQCEMENYIECCDVDFKSCRREPCYGFKLPLMATSGDRLTGVVDALRQMLAEEMLDGDNMYDAEGHGKQKARKGVRVSRLPPVLFLEITRSGFDLQQMETTFLKNRFDFPTKLNLTDFFPDAAAYSLHTVISHDTTTGNYNAHIRAKADSSFVKYLDDGNVVPCSEYSAAASKFGAPEQLVWNYFNLQPAELQAVPNGRRTRTRNEFACTLVYISERHAKD